LLFQSYDATAALIANTLSALAAHSGSRAAAAHDLDALRAVVREKARWDAPVQKYPPLRGMGRHGRRPAHEGGRHHSRPPRRRQSRSRREPRAQPLQRHASGAGHLHIRDGSARVSRRSDGDHDATAGGRELLAAGLDPATLGPPVAYRRSANVRMALWAAP
jgi:hypothetical protein